MLPNACRDPIPLDALIEYTLGELAEPRADEVEAHYFECAPCSARLAALGAIGDGVRGLMLAGRLTASVPEAVLDRARDAGLGIRRYTVAAGQVVSCTAAPADDFVAIELEMNVDPAETVDLDVETAFLASGQRERRRFEALCVDRAAGRLVLLFSGEQIRALPRTAWSMHAVLQSERGARTLGAYQLDHTPWEELDPRPS